MSIYYCEFGTRESKNLIFDYYYSVYLVIFFRKLQNIVRYTILILVQTSRKYLIFGHYIQISVDILLWFWYKKVENTWFFGHHYCVNLMYFIQNLQNIGRHTGMILVTRQNICRYTIVILVQVSQKTWFLTIIILCIWWFIVILLQTSQK